MEQPSGQRLADIACGDAFPNREEAMYLARREKFFRRIENVLRRHNSPAVNTGAHGLASECLKIIDQPAGEQW